MDLIDRQAAQNIIDELLNGFVTDSERNILEHVNADLGELQPVDSSDLISKQSAIDYFASNVFIIDTDGNCIEDENECRQVWTERFNRVT